MDGGWRGDRRPQGVLSAADPDRRAGDDARTDDGASGERYTLAELTEAAGVSVRTVRYYIAEGLLPPPVGSGPRSFYTGGHRDRLRVIGRLRERYLPLKEIRRQLDGWSETEIRRLARGGSVVGGDRVPDPWSGRASGSGAEPDAGPPVRPEPAPASGGSEGRARADRAVAESAADYAAALLESPPGAEASQRWAAERRGFAVPASAPTSVPEADAAAAGPGPWLGSAASEEASGETWRRFRLGDDAELLVRSSAYERRRERIEWLVRWAAKVFR